LVRWLGRSVDVGLEGQRSGIRGSEQMAPSIPASLRYFDMQDARPADRE
jgi:hypothetical protein